MFLGALFLFRALQFEACSPHGNAKSAAGATISLERLMTPAVHSISKKTFAVNRVLACHFLSNIMYIEYVVKSYTNISSLSGSSSTSPAQRHAWIF